MVWQRQLGENNVMVWQRPLGDNNADLWQRQNRGEQRMGLAETPRGE